MILAPLTLFLALAQNPQQPPEVLDRHAIEGADILRTYEVRDLLPTAQNASRLRQMGYVGETDDGLDAELTRRRQSTIDFLTDVIAREVQPRPDAKVWKIRITPNGTLVLHALLPQHEWVQSFLDRNRPWEIFITLETTWIEGPKGAFQRMGIPAGASTTVLESKDRARFLALGKDDKRFSVLNRPRLTVNPLAIGTLYDGETLSYVKDYKLETVQPGDVKIADPQIGRIAEGLELRAQAALLDAQKVSISLEASATAVRRPIPTKSYRLAPEIATEVTVSMPEVDRKSVQARCTLGPDATVAFCAPCAGNDEREFLILVSARAQTAAELQAPPK